MGLRSKLRTFAENPAAAMQAKARQGAVLFLQKWAERQMRRKGQLGLFTARPATAFPPDFADLWMLYRLIRARRPASVLEFGSGCSTIIVAQALWENAQSGKSGRLYSVDAVQYWAEETRRSLPEHLRKVCELTFSPVIECDYRGTPVFRHASVPDVRPDFLYLDGPPLTRDRNVAVDALDLEPRFLPGFMMLCDGRFANARFLQQYFTRRYSVTPSYLYGNTAFTLLDR